MHNMQVFMRYIHEWFVRNAHSMRCRPLETNKMHKKLLTLPAGGAKIRETLYKEVFPNGTKRYRLGQPWLRLCAD